MNHKDAIIMVYHMSNFVDVRLGTNESDSILCLDAMVLAERKQQRKRMLVMQLDMQPFCVEANKHQRVKQAHPQRPAQTTRCCKAAALTAHFICIHGFSFLVETVHNAKQQAQKPSTKVFV